MRNWLLLASAIVTEAVASLSLKAALDVPVLYVVVVFGFATSFGLLSMVLRGGMPLGVAYGIWGALGVAITAGTSHVVFGEPISTVMGVGIMLVIAGVLTVELGSHRPTHRPTSNGETP